MRWSCNIFVWFKELLNSGCSTFQLNTLLQYVQGIVLRYVAYGITTSNVVNSYSPTEQKPTLQLFFFNKRFSDRICYINL